ncbi:MAG: glycosyl hydrolase, partial [Acidobacteriota bacterium]
MAAFQMSAQSKAAPLNTLERSFEDPPQAAKLRCYWWWLNGYTTAETITRDLTQMKQRGYGGVILVDAYSKEGTDNPNGAVYGSPAWMKLYLHALQLAQQLGMEISLTITNGGNVGILGGSGVTPQDALKTLTSTRIHMTGGHDANIKLPMPTITNGYYQPIAVLAYPLHHGAPLPGESGSKRAAISALAQKAAIHEGNFSMPRPESTIVNIASVPNEQDAMIHDVIDVSAHMSSDGTLHWNVPAGEWEILRVGYTDSTVVSLLPSGNALGADMMNTQAFDHYWDRVVVPILTASKPYIGKRLRYLVTDSWESDAINWTGDFRQQFIRLRGYDPLPYLPIIDGRILDSRDTSDRFLADLRRTIADLIATRYYDHFSERAAAYGLGTHPEAGGPHSGPLDALRNFRGSAFPQTEFWAWSPEHRTTDEDRFFVKEAASAAHIYGKTFVAAEGFSCMGPAWAESPSQNLKPTFDRALTEGLNHLFWHESTSVPASEGLPGNEYFAGTHLNANTTWWNQAGPVLRGLNRAQFLMQQGQPVADLLFYYGEQVPQFARLKNDDPAHVLPGYDYDVTDEDALEHRMIATDGGLHTPEGIRYRALALPYSRALSISALKWLEKYVHSGGTAIGLEPEGPLGIVPSAQLSEYKRISTSMWQHCSSGSGVNSVRYGQGRIYCTQDAHAVFNAMHLSPDFTYTASDSTVSLDYIHRRTSTAEIYFIRNANDAPAQATLTFRAR